MTPVDNNNNNNVVQLVNLNEVPKFQEEPIRKIPLYVFENCNQVTCHNYHPDYFEKLRQKAIAITKTETGKLFTNPDLRVKKEEEFDWIYGLDYIEKEYLADDAFIRGEREITAGDVIKANGKFSRFSNEKPGDYRKRGIRWLKYETTLTEDAAIVLLETSISSGKPASFLPSLSDPFSLQPKPYKVKASWLKQKLDYYKKNSHRTVFENATLEKVQQGQVIQPEIVNEWGKKYGKEMFNVNEFLKDRLHYFPEPSQLDSKLQECLDGIKDPNMHPIEKASRIWFDIVRLHISHEANKRTGKAIGSMILLKSGYLPPKIGKESTEKYVKALENGFEDKDGAISFTNFVAKKITETTQEYSNILV